MSRSIDSINYTYPVPEIGSELLDSSIAVGTPGIKPAIGEIANAYDKLFASDTGVYSVIQKNLCTELNKILKLLGYNANYTQLPLDVTKVFDENELVDPNCKETVNAYKYYLREIVNGINALYNHITVGQNLIAQLRNLSGIPSYINDQSHVFITHLECLDEMIQDTIKKFSSYSIVKNVEVTTFAIQQKDYEEDSSTEIVSQKQKEYVEVAYKNLQTGYTSILKDSYASLNDLRNVPTEKQSCQREITNLYYLQDEQGFRVSNKYNESANVNVMIKDTVTSTTTSPLALFEELTLLDKLKYIVLYHKTQGDHYVFPDDAKMGYPCVLNPVSTSLTEETTEVGNLEMFFIGYLVDRDGPINALASFMEFKATAIRQQIQLKSYQLQALNMYVKLINQGLDALNKSQATGTEKIPIEAYMILRYVVANTARTYLRFTDDQGRYLKDANGNVIDTSNYLVLQYLGENGDTTAHFTSTNNYILIKANEAGINAFLQMAKTVQEKLDYLFKTDEKDVVYGLETSFSAAEQAAVKEHQEAVLRDYIQGNGTFVPDYAHLPDSEKYHYYKVSVKTDTSSQISFSDLYRSVNSENLYGTFGHDQTVQTFIVALPPRSSSPGTIPVSFSTITGVTQSGGRVTQISTNRGTFNVTHITGSSSTVNVNDWSDKTGNSLVLHCASMDSAKNYLPKELGVVPIDVTSALKSNYAGGVAWNDTSPDKDVSLDSVWPQLINTWQTLFQTSQENYQSKIQATTQEISSLQKKLDTFNTTGVTFRNKAYTIFNKIVNLLS